MNKRNSLFLPVALAAVLGLAGCTRTKFAGPGFTLDRFSFLQKLEFADVTMNTNGTASVRGYKNDGGTEAAAALTAAAVSAAIHAAKTP